MDEFRKYPTIALLLDVFGWVRKQIKRIIQKSRS